MQCCALKVTGKISKEFIGECWTYSISVLPRLQLLGVSRAILREKKHDVFTFQFPFSLETRKREELSLSSRILYKGDTKVNPTQKGTEMFIMLKRKLFQGFTRTF